MSRSRIVLFFAPLLAFAFVWTLPHTSARLTLILHGHPFASIVPKDRLDVFQFVPTDNFRAQAIVFSRSQAIGYIDEELSGFPHFVPFSATPNFSDFQPIDPLFDVIFLLLYVFKWWWLVAVYALLFARWFILSQRRHLTSQSS